MKLPGQRSGFHICDILNLNTAPVEPKQPPVVAAPPAPDGAKSPLTPPGTSPPMLHHVGAPASGSGANVRAGGASSSAALFGLPLHQHPSIVVPGPHQPMHVDEAVTLQNHHHHQQHHHYMAASRHHSHAAAAAAAAAAAGAMISSHHPYGAQSTFNHAMLSAFATSMFQGAKPWFHETEHYGESRASPVAQTCQY